MSDSHDGTGPGSDGHEVSTPPGVPEDGDGPGLAAGSQGTEPPSEASGDQSVDRPGSSGSGGTIAVEDEQPDAHPASEETDRQRENTEASTQQPSQ